MSNEIESITIELVKKDDFEQWRLFWLDYQAFYKVALSDKTTEITWNRFFDQKIPIYCALAKEGENILGFVHFVFHPSTWAENDFCYLEDLFVSPESRGKQVGKQLIEYVQRQALNQNCARLYWHTQESNLTAQKLYDWIAEKPSVIEYRMAL